VDGQTNIFNTSFLQLHN